MWYIHSYYSGQKSIHWCCDQHIITLAGGISRVFGPWGSMSRKDHRGSRLTKLTKHATGYQLLHCTSTQAVPPGQKPKLYPHISWYLGMLMHSPNTFSAGPSQPTTTLNSGEHSVFYTTISLVLSWSSQAYAAPGHSKRELGPHHCSPLRSFYGPSRLFMWSLGKCSWYGSAVTILHVHPIHSSSSHSH